MFISSKSLKGQRDTSQGNVSLLEVSVQDKTHLNLRIEFVDHGLATAGIVAISVGANVVSEALRVQPVACSCDTLKAQVEVVEVLECHSLELTVAINALLGDRHVDGNHAISVLTEALEIELQLVLVDVQHLSNGALVGHKDSLSIEADKHATGDGSWGDVIVLLEGRAGDGILGLKEADLWNEKKESNTNH